MAKRKTKKSKSRRRSRVGALNGDMSLLIGAVGGALVARIAASKMTSVKPVYQAAGQAAIGFILSKQTNSMFRGAGIGLFVSGAISGAQSLNMLSGIIGRADRPIVFNTAGRQLNGADGVPQISGYNHADDLGNPELALISGLYDDYS